MFPPVRSSSSPARKPKSWFVSAHSVALALWGPAAGTSTVPDPGADMDMDLDLDPDRDAAVSRRPLPLFAGAAAVPAPPPLVLSGAGAPPPTLTAPAAPAPARAEPRRRNRPALSCIQCRTRKIRCDRHEPCSSCIKSKIVNCTYEEGRRPKPRLWRLSPAPADAPPERSPTGERQLSIGFGYTFREMDAPSPPQPPHPAYSVSAATAPGRFPEPASTPSPMTQADLGETSSAGLAERVRQLEHQLADALARPDRGPPPSRPARAALCPDRSALSIVPGTALLTDGDKLVGRLLPHLTLTFHSLVRYL